MSTSSQRHYRSCEGPIQNQNVAFVIYYSILVIMPAKQKTYWRDKQVENTTNRKDKKKEEFSLSDETGLVTCKCCEKYPIPNFTMTRNSQSEFVTGSKRQNPIKKPSLNMHNWSVNHRICAIKYQNILNYDFLLFNKFVTTKRQFYFTFQNFFAKNMSKQHNKKSFGK